MGGMEQVSESKSATSTCLVRGVVADDSLILAVNQIALAEGVALGKSLGIDPVLLHSVINSSSGQSTFFSWAGVS